MPLNVKSWLFATALIAALATSAFAQKAPDATTPAKPSVSHQSSVEKMPAGKAESSADQAVEKAESLDLMSMVFVFMLATFIGIGVIMRVSRLLHTPLMSLTNAISAIAVVGSIIVTGGQHPWWITLLGGVALFASMTNIVSGFLITDRMLKMFKKREPNKS